MSLRRIRTRPAIGILLASLLVLVGCGTQPAAKPPAPAVTQPTASAPAAPAPTVPQQKDVDFSGKTIEVVVNYTAGGPTDTFNRLIANYLGKYIPGKPTIVVKNVAGAAGMIGANTVYASPKKDGTVIGGFTTAILQSIVGDPGAQYDLTKFRWVAAAQEGQVFWARSDMGVKSPDEFASAPKQIRAAGMGASTQSDLVMLFFLDAVGADYKHIVGYPGGNDMWMALQQNEADLMGMSLTLFFDKVEAEVKKGDYVVLGQSGVLDADGKIVRDPRIPNVPTVLEVEQASVKNGPMALTGSRLAALELLVGTRTLLRGMLLPPGTPDDVLMTLRKAYEQVFNDAEFREAARKQLSFDFMYIPGETAEKLSRKILTQAKEDPDAVALLKKMAGTQ